MIHHRRTVQIAPGRQADAVARMHEWVAIWKEAAGAKANAHPDWIALWAKVSQEWRDGTNPWVPNTLHDDYWRDA